jgi:hypothetical protein
MIIVVRRSVNTTLVYLITINFMAAKWFAPPPKNPSQLEKFSSGFFEIKTASSSLIIFQRGQTINVEYYSYLLVQLKDILKEKRCVAGR